MPSAAAETGTCKRWRELRETIHREVCEKGFDSQLNSFTQTYGSKRLDASLLLMPLVGFLPVEDERVRGTIDSHREAPHARWPGAAL